MKTTIIAACLLLCGYLNAQTYSLEVNMSGFKNNKGKVKVGLYTSETSFLKVTFLSLDDSIKNNQAKVMFKNLEKGEYAVSIYHDENNNNEMDKNFFGIPKEAYASSNNAKGSFGPPKYTDAKFIVKEDTTLHITID
ncbi:MAG: hypothetical protein CMP76_13470 [Flavobacterium sp.]|uniref:DUF2141 domain-containing protein n=1 Tax=Flavobacterium sp. TaxID=239 RepID=UPI000C488EF9|nr:DUF2141 domain-containing protein [Flavobacterium sp.]MBF04294.1 hypothetical protein [Flavobacterium sp.]|tara:strand:+ start:160 stop:570 length:411 start_codon:yes stop_codon:yes gene_type:complete